MLLSALILGLVGSFHCVGMCGPIALALPVGNGSRIHKIFSYATYHIGKLSAYAVIGFLFGVLGYGLDMAGFQQTISLAVGLFMLAYVWFPKFFQRMKIGGPLIKFQSSMTAHMAKRIKSNRTSALMGLGFFNGLLPCGLVYVAVAASMSTFEPLNGALFMVLFGVGTIPALTLVVYTGHRIGSTFRMNLQKAVPIIVTAFAILFILRGLGLGIPYLSPELNHVVSNQENCAP